MIAAGVRGGVSGARATAAGRKASAAGRSGVFLKTDGLPKLAKAMKAIPSRDVLVGVPDDRSRGREERGPQAGKNRRDDGPLTNAQLSYIHENGSPDVGIPARAHHVPGIREARPRFVPKLKAATVAMLDGDRAKADKNLHAAGLIAMSGIQTKLKTGPFTPLAPATIARRRRRSKGSSYRRKATTAAEVKPLIDTAQLLRAQTYVVRG